MEEILHAFGIDWRLIVIQIFNFGLLLGILWYFLYTPVLRMLAEREAKIKEGVRNAEEAQRTKADAEAQRTEIIKVAHNEAADIVARSTAHAQAREKELLEEAAEKIARERRAAQTAAEQLKTQALKESEAEIAKLALLTAEKVLNKELSK